jgi:hypothetical protein
VGKCRADRNGSAVQLFENGWLIDRFSDAGDVLFAIGKTGEGHLRWFKRKSGYVNGMEAPCAGIDGENMLRWAFRWWYCSQNAEEIRRVLGKPLIDETAVWAQFQEWSQGLLVVGLPGDRPGVAIGKFQVLFSVFLVGEGEQEEGVGQLSQHTWLNVDCEEYCNAIWYSTKNRLMYSNGKCSKIHTEDEFIAPRDNCSICEK